jgi:N-methylhydantoinase B
MSPDSGGPGQFRGGVGVIRELTWLGPEAILAIRIDGIKNPAWGVNGGQAGRPGCCFVNRGATNEIEVSPLSDGTRVRAGDVIRFQTCGGGGWGHPFDRDPQLVLDDVRGGYFSVELALDDYGVVIRVADDEHELDLTATEAFRGKQRPQTKLFHNGQYVAAME